MQEMAHIPKGQDPGNCVSLLRASAMNSNESSSMLILQETCTDASGSLVVYDPVDIAAMHVVMSGGDPAYVALLPSGFSILPDGPECRPLALNPTGKGVGVNSPLVGGSLLTVAFQILVNSLPIAKLTVESVETVNNLISCTVQKIKVLDDRLLHFCSLIRVSPGSPDYRVGFRLGDVVVQFDGKPTKSIKELSPGSPDYRAGFRPGDVVVQFDGKPTKSIKEIVEIMGDKVGVPFKVIVKRLNNRQLTLTIVPEEANPNLF